MTKATYRPADDMPQATSNLGFEFKAGEAVDLVEADAKIIAKLRGHPFFDVEGAPEKQERVDGKPAPVPPFEAKEKSAGWWGIFDANGQEIGKSMRQDDAEAFNSMNDEDKAAYVAVS